MSELISGKEALIALANGEDVDYLDTRGDFKGIGWSCAKGMQAWLFLEKDSIYKFRLKPRTITINNIEVPAPFEPKDGDEVWHIFPTVEQGYGWCNYEGDQLTQFGAWRTAEEIKQVVAALRSVFKPQ